MSRLREEIRVIPRAAWWIACLVYLCVMILLTWATTAGHSAELRNMHILLKILFAKVLPLIPFALTLLIGYVHADAKRRGMRYIMWTFLAIFIPQAMGIILYFVFREPLPAQCPGCRVLVRPGFTFCPFCAAALAPTCPHCKRSVEAGWSNCAYCGNPLAGKTPPGAP